MTRKPVVLLALLLLAGLASCEFFSRPRSEVKPHEWWEERGPIVPHDSFPKDCSSCHLSSGWHAIREDFEFDHLGETGVPLNGAHATAECLRCHNDRGPVALFADRGCVGCHEDIHRGQLGKVCTTCHTEDTWVPLDMIVQHNDTRFPLVGAHAATACFECHEGAQVGNFSRADIECHTCHSDDLGLATNPDHVAQGWVTDCDKCHQPTVWAGAGFSHSQFPLVGGHASARCEDCHAGGTFAAAVSSECAACHLDDYSAATNPVHSTSGFSTNCEDCHTVFDFQGAVFDHSQFPLVGGHAGVSCVQCHPAGSSYQATAADCYSCHATDYDKTEDPSHAASGFGTDCESCHSPATWDEAFFDHSQFPLTGAHAGTSCVSCHQGGVYEGTPGDCFSCHSDDYAATKAPNHQQAGFPTDCATCHNTNAFQGADFDHGFYPLVGQHATATCNSCHQGGVFQGTDTDCFSCHADDYAATTDPNHKQAGFPTDCATCHNTNGFQGADFDHGFYPLTGQHAAATCNSCHQGGVFQGTDTDCFSCHADDYAATTDPNHKQAGFPTDCATCHNTNGFQGADFDHGFYPLTGQHAAATCNSCHQGGVFQGTDTDCFSCHADDYAATTDPNHAQAGFPTDCATCHNTNGFQGADFDHGFYPLTGAHAAASCNSCHQGGVFQGTDTDCFSCHADDYAATTDPNHAQAGFPTDCATCHNTNGFQGADFDHSFYPLTGAHAAASCNSCHQGGVFQGTSTDCYSCHANDYTGAKDPNHLQAGFPTDCATCHNTASFQGADFDHSFYPLTGQHAAASCNSCHQGGVFQGTSTDCYSCHASDYAASADPPHVLKGFPTECAMCHETNGWASTFYMQHTFILDKGPHSKFMCIECHQSQGSYAFASCIHCHSHNEQKMWNKHMVDHNVPGYTWTDAGCIGCHPTGKD